MAQRYIYLNDELNQLLKKEINASALIVRLLNEYYKTNQVKSKEELIHNAEEIDYKIKHSIQELEKEKEVVVEQIQVIETEAEIAEKIRIKALTKKQEFWNNCKKNLEDFSNNTITKEIVDEYVNAFTLNQDLNIIDFIAEKGL